jgi:hypothetical protein
MAQRLAVDYDESFFMPPATNGEIALYAYRIGLSLLMAYTYTDGWTQTDSTARSGRQARRSAKRTRAALLGPRGPDALSLMTQGYTWEMAQLWSRAGARDAENRSGLIESARRAEHVSELAADCWPVQAREIRERVAKFEDMRHFDPDNPDLKIDLHAYAGRARAVTVALVSLLGDESQDAGALFFRIMSLDSTFASATATDWNFEGELLANLLHEEPLPYAAMLQRRNAAAPGG